MPSLCLNIIFKNESYIISRLLDSVVDIIDCYCLCDTGSTDDSVQVITDYFIKKGIPGKIVYEPFKNFAHNRSFALQACKGMSDYALLLDADMILKVSDKFDKKHLVQDYYYIFQGNEAFYYQNVRLVRNNGLFSYSGVTHEHINVPPRNHGGKVFDKKVIFIHDIGDGGSKSDKFPRDIRLLEQGLKDEPGNTRYYFYLGNSYRDDGQLDKAIETYKHLLTLNGWIQEKFCACLSIGNMYHTKNDNVNATKYWLKTSEYDNERIEGVVRAADYYRHAGENVVVNLLYNKHKNYKKNLADGKLFVEQDKYWDILEYHNSISAFYVNDKESGYECCRKILINNIISKPLLKSTLENMRFYKDFLMKDTEVVRDKILTIIESLLEDKKKDNEIWRALFAAKKDDGITFTIKEVVDDGQSKDNKAEEIVAIDNKAEDVVLVTDNKKEEVYDIEDLYQRIKQLRFDGKHTECFDLIKTINKEDYPNYLWQLEYEYSVIAYYLGVRNINDQVVTIMNNCEDSLFIISLLSNMKFYPNILKADKVYDFTLSLKHKLNDVEYSFNSSSSCIISNADGYLLNVRYVNYTIDEEGRYHDCENHIITINRYYELDKEFAVTRDKLINIEYVDKHYIGVEDVRIFKDNKNVIKFIGSSLHTNNKIGIVEGNYDINNDVLSCKEIIPAFNMNYDCEKNWVYMNYKGETHIVYSWFPLKICKTDSKYPLLEFVEERTMPSIFKLARGSTCGVMFKNESIQNELCQNELSQNELWFVTHLVSYESPRSYYHMLVIFDENMNLLRYSAPFKFEGEKIEYCLGLVVEEERVIMTYSSWDRTTKIAIYSKKYIDGLTIY